MKREPLFNAPGVVVALIGVFIAVHVLREAVLSEADSNYFDLLFAFIPARYDSSLLLDGTFPGGAAADIWTFVTYAFIHGGWTHLVINTVWFLPFGSAVARRFGTLRFLAFFAVTAAAGAVAHLLSHGGQGAPVIGASAAISGTMAGALRFAFARGGPLGGFWGGNDDASYRVPALPLTGLLRTPRALIFLVVWFGLNLLFGILSLPIGDAAQPVAWEAHLGGFIAGLLMFSLFDPVRR